MFPYFKISLVSIAIFIFLGNTKGQTLSNSERIKIEKQVDSVFQSAIKYAENLEYDKLSAGVDDKQNAGFIANGAYYQKYDSLVAVVKSKSVGISGHQITLQHKKVTVLSHDIVLITAIGNSKVEVANGTVFNVKFFWTFVYERVNHQWKVIQSHQSTVR